MPEVRYAALAVGSRRRLLDLLRAADRPVDAASLADQVGLHLTTVRFHLGVLERTGLVHRVIDRDGRPGRPRQLYLVVDEQLSEEELAHEGYRKLAEVLAEALDGDADVTRRRAEEAGRRWACAEVPLDDLSWEDGTRQVGVVFIGLGFAPRLLDDAQGRHLELAGCPFRDLARDHPEVVCAVHVGLLRGALSRLSVPDADRAQIRPFVETELCIADIPPPPVP